MNFWIPVNIVELSCGTHSSHSEMVEFFQVLILSFIRWHQMAVCLGLFSSRYWSRTFLRYFLWYSMKSITLAGGNMNQCWPSVTFWECSLSFEVILSPTLGGFFTCMNWFLCHVQNQKCLYLILYVIEPGSKEVSIYLRFTQPVLRQNWHWPPDFFLLFVPF